MMVRRNERLSVIWFRKNVVCRGGRCGRWFSVISDRTATIRASVADVQFTLLLTIGLVVGVIFLFLRSLWATLIPAIAVPVSITGTFGGGVCPGLQSR